MIFLISESSTLLGSVALYEDDQLLGYRESIRQGSHSETMNTLVEQIMAEQIVDKQITNKKKGPTINLNAVDLFVSGIGPGSFTGIRVSLNLIKTFAYCFNKPVLGINSLETLAMQAGVQSLPIVCMINAYKNMVYIATYQHNIKGLSAIKLPEVVRVQDLKNYINCACMVVGDGYLAYAQYFSPQIEAFINRPVTIDGINFDEPTAQATGLVAMGYLSEAQNWSKILPLYLRSSEAEEVKKGITYQPLN